MVRAAGTALEGGRIGSGSTKYGDGSGSLPDAADMPRHALYAHERGAYKATSAQFGSRLHENLL